MNKFVYMDNSATTKMDKQVLEAIMPYLTEEYGNASSIYSIGRNAKRAIENAREQVAELIGCKTPKNIYFTGSGTEADNWAITGVAYANKNKGNHIISSKIEHHAVLHTLEHLEKQGFEVTYLPVDEYGVVSIDDLKASIKDTTILISIMYANNEIGTIEPIEEIAKVAKEHKILFHTDAVQAVGNVNIDVEKTGIDLLSLSAHKIHGPKGVGALYVRGGIKIENLMYGGAQERTRRPSTENVAGIVGLGAVATMAKEKLDENVSKIISMRERLIGSIEKTIPYSRLNGHRTNRLCTNVNFSFEYVEGEAILLMLDMYGIAASSGSACTTGSLDPSHVLLAIGLTHEIAHGSIRFSLSNETTDEEIDYVLETLPIIIEKLRKMSPLYEGVESRKG